MFKRIMLASDLTAASKPAFEVAVRLARTFKADLVLCHVYQPMFALAMAPRARRLRKEVRAQLVKDVARRLGALEAVARRARLKVTPLIVDGSPGGAVARAAKQASADLVVVGSRGRRGIAGALVGSVAEAIVRRAPCPVLVVRGARPR